MTRSPGRMVSNITDNEDEDHRTLNPGKGNISSNRKIKPMYYNNQNKMLKVVQEDDMASGGTGNSSHIYLPKSNFVQVVGSPQYGI
jgi:hypothetical protein